MIEPPAGGDAAHCRGVHGYRSYFDVVAPAEAERHHLNRPGTARSSTRPAVRGSSG